MFKIYLKLREIYFNKNNRHYLQNPLLNWISDLVFHLSYYKNQNQNKKIEDLKQFLHEHRAKIHELVNQIYFFNINDGRKLYEIKIKLKIITINLMKMEDGDEEDKEMLLRKQPIFMNLYLPIVD